MNDSARIREIHLQCCEFGSKFHNKDKVPVVVLTRLPEYKVSALRPPTPAQFYSEEESHSSSDSDMLWAPEGDSSDSDFSPAHKKQKVPKSPRTDTKETVSLPSTSKTSNAPSAPSASSASSAPSAPSASSASSEPSPIIISSAFGTSSQETTKVRPVLPETEIKLDMEVVARRRPMKWHQGKIVEIVEKDDGRLKYKVSFESAGRSLVSGHHLACTTSPKLEELYVGARVTVQCQDNKSRFRPGILSELPTRRNRLRFLVFLDDHTPIYVGLPLLHLICKPLENPLDDIPDDSHRHFMKQYMKSWPYPHLTQYQVGQNIRAVKDDVMQNCDIQLIDSSLILVLFKDSHHKEWIHRGSLRLEHMARFLEMREKLDNDSKK